MRLRFISIGSIVLAASAVLGGVVLADLLGGQRAGGTVNVTTEAAELHICETFGEVFSATTTTTTIQFIPGPDCGFDDSGADEEVFETVENISPGRTAEWDVRLKNVGTRDWIVQDVVLGVVERHDPGNDCIDFALEPGRILPGLFSSAEPLQSLAGVFVLTDGDNDNLRGIPGFATFAREDDFFGRPLHIKVTADGFEDVRLRLWLPGEVASSTTPIDIGNCEGNVWNVSWQFVVR